MKLLQKMGWQPGEGLGRNKEGSLEPLALDIKMDKKGLVCKEDISFKMIQGFNGNWKAFEHFFKYFHTLNIF